jgi:hypothetical protein
MSVTDLAAVTNQIQKFWAPIFMPELKAQAKLPGLVSRDYEGEIKAEGDTVYVSQLVIPDAQEMTVGTRCRLVRFPVAQHRTCFGSGQ